jgi:hypothetical protein
MPLFHITTTDRDIYWNAVQNGSFVILDGIKWIAGQPWVEAALKSAEFEHAVIYWTGTGSPSVGIDFGDHDIATRAIVTLHNTEFNGYILKARWHQDVGNYLRQFFTFAC